MTRACGPRRTRNFQTSVPALFRTGAGAALGGGTFTGTGGPKPSAGAGRPKHRGPICGCGGDTKQRRVPDIEASGRRRARGAEAGIQGQAVKPGVTGARAMLGPLKTSTGVRHVERGAFQAGAAGPRTRGRTATGPAKPKILGVCGARAAAGMPSELRGNGQGLAGFSCMGEVSAKALTAGRLVGAKVSLTVPGLTSGCTRVGMEQNRTTAGLEATWCAAPAETGLRETKSAVGRWDGACFVTSIQSG